MRQPLPSISFTCKVEPTSAYLSSWSKALPWKIPLSLPEWLTHCTIFFFKSKDAPSGQWDMEEAKCFDTQWILQVFPSFIHTLLPLQNRLDLAGTFILDCWSHCTFCNLVNWLPPKLTSFQVTVPLHGISGLECRCPSFPWSQLQVTPSSTWVEGSSSCWSQLFRVLNFRQTIFSHPLQFDTEHNNNLQVFTPLTNRTYYLMVHWDISFPITRPNLTTHPSSHLVGLSSFRFTAFITLRLPGSSALLLLHFITLTSGALLYPYPFRLTLLSGMRLLYRIRPFWHQQRWPHPRLHSARPRKERSFWSFA